MNIPCCFYPTQTILLDDDQRFLETMNIGLGHNHVLKLFQNPQELVDYLFSKADNPFTKRCINRPEEMEIDHRIIDVDIQAIAQEMYNPKRFLETTVIVIDYAMPSMHGLDVCKALRHLPVKKILLTGEANDKIAIDAFNRGLIDKFIRKGGPTAPVASDILELQLKYFTDLSTVVIDSLTKNPEYPPSCLNDPIFVSFFNSFYQQYKFTEFYLLDASGSFIFFDEFANPTFLIVKDEEAMQANFELAELSDAPIDESLLNALKNREKLLYFFDGDHQKYDSKNWSQYAHNVEKLVGRDNYYYAICKDPNLYDIKRQNILSYDDYLRTL